MADIFGREAHDYEVVRALQEENQWEGYQASNTAFLSGVTNPAHDFNALGSHVGEAHRAAEDAQSVAYLTNSLLALQTMVDEIMYTAYRLPAWVHINTNIPDGAATYGIRVMDRVGQAQRVVAPGFDAPSASVSQAIVTQPLHLYGLDAEWSIDELRGAQFSGMPLDTQSIEAAVTGTMETMESVGLTGGDYPEKGLLNLATGTGEVNLSTQASNMTFADLTAVAVRDLINGTISKVIEGSKETMGRQVNSGLTVYLPGEQYDMLTTKYIGDNAEHTLMASIMRDNPWTHFTGNPIAIERVLELSGAGASNTDRMVIGIRDSRVAEMGVSIPPRVLRIMDKGRLVCGMIEAKFSPLFVKRPTTIYYVDAI